MKVDVFADMSTLRLDTLAAPPSSSQAAMVNPATNNNVVPPQMRQAQQLPAQPLPIEVKLFSSSSRIYRLLCLFYVLFHNANKKR